MASRSLALLVAAPALAFAQTPVARISVELPQMEHFILHATVPVPPGTFRPTAANMPLAIVSGGLPATTQIESVTRFPRDVDGAAVVELIARVSRPPGASPGTEQIYDVVLHDHARGNHQPGAGAAALLATPGAVQLATRDLHGNRFAADLYAKPRAGVTGTTRLREGAHVRELRTHEVLTLQGTPQGQALPHLMGVHATFRTYTNEDFVLLDLHVHNGMDGRDFSTPIDDVVSDIYFEQLDLELPPGWEVATAFGAPYVGAPVADAGHVDWPLIKALPESQMHLLPQQAQFVRRYVIARPGASLDRGREVLARRNFGFATPGFVNPTQELWSWWNPSTGGYLPQRRALPTLGHMNLASLRGSIQGSFDQLANLVATGERSPQGPYPLTTRLLGWAHPWGYAHGGVAGGQEIEQWPGVDIFWARSQVGLRFTELKAQCYEDRQPVALYTSRGTPSRFEDMVQPPGPYGPWIPSYFNLRPSAGSAYFTFSVADRAQPILAYESYRIPYYEKELRTFQPIDIEHLTRYLNAYLVLAWLANDAEAKRALELHSELHRITLSEYYNSNYGHIQGVGLLTRIQAAQSHGGKGGNWGRSEAWGLQANLAWYALGPDELRARYRPWFALISQTLRDTVSTCTGNLTSHQVYQGPFKGVYQIRQSFEAGFMLHAVEGLRRTVFEGTNQAVYDSLTTVLHEGAEASIEPPFWNPAQRAQHRHVATRRIATDSSDFCTNIPHDGFTDFYDSWSGMTGWAYAYTETRNSIYLLRAAEAIGGANALAGLESQGLVEIDEKAPMMALLQFLNR